MKLTKSISFYHRMGGHRVHVQIRARLDAYVYRVIGDASDDL